MIAPKSTFSPDEDMQAIPFSGNPDQFLDYPTPGAQEWWYFDAISDDARDVIVIVWYSALPFDPDYGVAAIRHLDRPDRFPQPIAKDHCAIGLSWYRDGKTIAYALNGYQSSDFRQRDDPFSLTIDSNHVRREGRDYILNVDTPSLSGRGRISAELRFEPARATESISRNLGSIERPHLWILAAGDCRVSGHLKLDGRKPISAEFQGRGYHDHNAGAEEISRTQSRWSWGRVHIGSRTHIYYRSESRQSGPRSIRITCEDGRPAIISDEVAIEEIGSSGNVFGIRHGKEVRIRGDQSELRDARNLCVDDGPFYRRWVGNFSDLDSSGETIEATGISEILDTRNLNRRLFNWMIPYRLKKPGRR